MNTFTLTLRLNLVATKYFYILYLVFWLPNILHMAANIYCFVMVAIYNNLFGGHQIQQSIQWPSYHYIWWPLDTMIYFMATKQVATKQQFCGLQIELFGGHQIVVYGGHQTSMWLKNFKNTVVEDTKIESFVVLVNISFQTFWLPLFVF